MDSSHVYKPTCQLNFTEPAFQQRSTTIIATISQASQNLEILKKMIYAGMRIARLNCSQDSQESHAKTINLLREACDQCSQQLGYTIQIALALETKGREIRTGFLATGPNTEIELKANDSIRLTTNSYMIDKGNKDSIYVDYENILDILLPGNVVFINDGALKLEVKKLGANYLTCQVLQGGMLGSHQKVILAGVKVDLAVVSEKDLSDIKFAVAHNVDMVFASSMRNVENVQEIRSLLGEKAKDIKLLAKCDSLEGLENIEDLASAADGILLDRIDIGMEIPAAKIFLAQKAIATLCNLLGKPFVIASQLLASMRQKSQPLRTEVADLGNAILDGVDCVVLSAETAVGKYPVECVAAMDGIIREFELALPYTKVRSSDVLFTNPSIMDAVHTLSISAVEAAKSTMATAIVVLTTSGRSAHLLAHYRPSCPILAVTRCSRTFKQCYLHRGVIPVLYKDKPNTNWMENVDARIQYALNIGKRMQIINTGDTVLIMSPWKEGAGFANNLRVVYAFFEEDKMDYMLKTDGMSTNKRSHSLKR
uniref:Pyruvate kinase n=1 Tax=Stomoxys calcitrans TaxID=35570 RepID=A0A1I8NXJ6_STOCA